MMEQNKTRLIDANKLIKKLEEKIINPQTMFINTILIDLLKDAPTAYDIDKVVEQLERLETYKQTVTMEKHPFCVSEIETVSKKKAIKIVKGNCSENPNSSKGGAE